MLRKKNIKKYREALKVLSVEKLKWYFDRGIFDDFIEVFLNGDSLDFTCDWSLVPNDVILMRELVGLKTDDMIISKARDMWEAEEK